MAPNNSRKGGSDLQPRSKAIPNPPGFPTAATPVSRVDKAPQRTPPTAEETDTLKVKKAWEVALAPVKSLPMTAFMMYMSGNSLQIFSIMMVFMAFKTPLLGLLNTNQAFERFLSDSNRSRIATVKLAYIGCQLIALAVGVWKVNSMGLLPTTRSDWLAWDVPRNYVDHAIMAL